MSGEFSTTEGERGLGSEIHIPRKEYRQEAEGTTGTGKKIDGSTRGDTGVETVDEGRKRT